jgi:hypothetical protein
MSFSVRSHLETTATAAPACARDLLCHAVAAAVMSPRSHRRYTCYRVTYATCKGILRQYWGMTEIRGSQSRAEACQVRLQKLAQQPLECMHGCEPASMKVVPEGSVLNESNALAQEAIFAAAALSLDSSARGACFCTRTLGSALRSAAAAVRQTVRGLRGHAARRAVLLLGSTLKPQHPLAMHLLGRCYRCGGKFRSCSCRAGKPQHARDGEIHRQKSRSGPSLSGSAKRKRQGLTPKDPRYYQLKWGSDVKANRAADNRKQNAKRSRRGS